MALSGQRRICNITSRRAYTRPVCRIAATGPVVSFVRTVPSVPVKPAHMGEALETAALNWLEAINSRRLGDAEALLAEAATHHDDGMWLLQPARGRTVIRRAWRDWLRSVPDYALSPVTIAVDTAGGDAFILWRASGMAKLPLVPQLPLTGKPFVHHGVTRLRFNAEGLITDQWTWRGPTSDEAKWLLLRSHRSFDCAAVVRDMYGGGGSPAGSPGGSPSASFDGAMLLRGSPPLMATATFGACGDSPAARAAGKAAALSFRDALGCNGGDVAGLEAILADNYSCHEGTGVWRSMNFPDRLSCMLYCKERSAAVSGDPYWHAEAITPDGRMMFVHFQNVLMARDSRTLVGLSSGVLVHLLDNDARIARTLIFRGPSSFAERAQHFNMDCRACGRSHADELPPRDRARALGGV